MRRYVSLEQVNNRLEKWKASLKSKRLRISRNKSEYKYGTIRGWVG